MKTNMKALIAAAAALVVAGGGYAALMLTDDDSSTDSSASSSASSSESSQASATEPFTEFEAADVDSVLVENESGSYEAVPVGEPDEDGTVTVTIKGFEDLDINTTMTSSLFNNAIALSPDSLVEEDSSQLEKYGLDQPRAKVTVTSSDTSVTLLIGDDSPVSGETYCKTEDSNSVYTISTTSVSVFLNEDTYYISTTLLETPDEEPIIEKLTISRTDLDYDMVLEYDSSGVTSGTMATHYMTEPLFAYLDPEKSQDEVAGLFGLSADSVITAHPTEDEINGSGFDQPFCTVVMECDDGSSYELQLGKELETSAGNYYTAMFTGKDVIYAIDADDLCWTEVEPDDIMSRMVFGTYVWDIGTLEITVNGEDTVTFSGSGESGDDYEVTKNGNSCDTTRFQELYSFLLKTSAEEFAMDEEPEGEPEVTIYLETQDGETKQTVEFYKAEGKKSLICVNGVPSFKCRTAYVDLLKENLEKFDGSESFVTNW